MYTITIQTTLIFHQSYTIIEYMLHVSKFRYRQTQASTKNIEHRVDGRKRKIEGKRKYSIHLEMICFSWTCQHHCYCKSGKRQKAQNTRHSTSTSSSTVKCAPQQKIVYFYTILMSEPVVVCCLRNELHFILSFCPFLFLF